MWRSHYLLEIYSVIKSCVLSYYSPVCGAATVLALFTVKSISSGTA
jgi:hypothetical protein